MYCSRRLRYKPNGEEIESVMCSFLSSCFYIFMCTLLLQFTAFKHHREGITFFLLAICLSFGVHRSNDVRWKAAAFRFSFGTRKSFYFLLLLCLHVQEKGVSKGLAKYLRFNENDDAQFRELI